MPYIRLVADDGDGSRFSAAVTALCASWAGAGRAYPQSHIAAGLGCHPYHVTVIGGVGPDRGTSPAHVAAAVDAIATTIPPFSVGKFRLRVNPASNVFRAEATGSDGSDMHVQAAAAALVHVGGNDYSSHGLHVTLGRFDGTAEQGAAFRSWLESRALDVSSLSLTRVEFEPDHLGVSWVCPRRALTGAPASIGSGIVAEDPACLAVYELAKGGDWAGVERTLSGMREEACRICLFYARPSSGWTIMHQAAYFGDEAAVAECIARQGIDPGVRAGPRWALRQLVARTRDGQTPADVAHSRGHAALAARLRATLASPLAVAYGSAAPTPAPPHAPSGPAASAPPPFCANLSWGQADRQLRACTAGAAFPVLYGSTVVTVRAGDAYWTDAGTGAVVVGWHGTVSPPCGMDGEPIV